ncbi:four helix bundle protein [Owenweeksia hongkongensis]|uniref:four helix bundle protein n=1 Tax=Owenweeksia hongkongensis TaxID=253245 RepID=UPI003A90C0C6
MAHYDLEERTLRFAKEIRKFIKSVKLTTVNESDCRQLIRSSGSVGVNYIEANESFSKKDFLFRAKISRKEVKESRFWLSCLENNIQPDLEPARTELHTEATEIMKILGAIIRNSEGGQV